MQGNVLQAIVCILLQHCSSLCWDFLTYNVICLVLLAACQHYRFIMKQFQVKGHTQTFCAQLQSPVHFTPIDTAGDSSTFQNTIFSMFVTMKIIKVGLCINICFYWLKQFGKSGAKTFGPLCIENKATVQKSSLTLQNDFLIFHPAVNSYCILTVIT